MQTLKKYHVIIIILMILSTIAALYSFFKEDIPKIVQYISLFVMGFTLALELLLQFSLFNVKKTIHMERKLRLWNSISYRVKNAGETSFNDLPIGIIVFDDEFVVEWSNKYANEIFMSSLVGRSFTNLDNNFASFIQSRTQNFEVNIYGKVYKCVHMLPDHVIYLSDMTSEYETKKLYDDRVMSLGILNLDNLETAMSTLEAEVKAHHISKLIGILTDWAEDYNICLKGYSDGRYIIIMDSAVTQALMKDRFPVLNKIQEYGEKEGIRITASIGISCKDVKAIELIDSANLQLELALNRGGNQAIVEIKNEISYYGAKSASFEMRTPVYIRVKTEDLVEMILKSDKVYIMGHREMDADAFGACLATHKIVQANDRISKIILNEKLIDETVTNVLDTIKSSHINFLDNFITPQDAMLSMTSNSLLIIVDCQYKNLLMSEKIYKKAKRIAVIDHHRRNPEAIKDVQLLYIQPNASSTVELLLEMFEYIDTSEIDITPVEATWMLMGIVVDTNTFIYRTTARTFAVLAKLQSYGADMAKVQRFLRENFEEYVKRMSIQNNMEILEDGYGIAICDNEIYERSFLAKITDNIIKVSNIKVAFCIGRLGKDEIGISARSLDEANVQIIMERLGGGGHYNNAATQLRGVTIEEAKEKLIHILSETLDKREKFMKIILIKDVKGKGRTNDVIDIPAGHANFLIRSGQAIEATVDNVKQLEMNQLKEEQAQAKLLHDMQELKKKIDAMTVKVLVKVGTSGKLFGSVTMKEIAEAFKTQNNIELDKRKILYDKTIDALGTYQIPIQLHREVTATITLYVVEQGAK